MRKIYKKILLPVLVIALLLNLTSCIRFRFSYNFDFPKNFDFIKDFFGKGDENNIGATNSIISTSTKSEANNANDTWDTITSLDGDVYTLSKYELPKVGDVLNGFEVKLVFDYSEKNAKVVMFEHIKTGAVCFLISNDDIDKSASFGFNTLAYDDKGLPHVFEHATLGGSEKYPNTNLFFEMIAKTYKTFLNAFTMQQGTAYPMGSLSDEQLFAYFKYYIDGVFYPTIMGDEKILDSEAYRYSLSDKDSDINLSGIVYSEMSACERDIYLAAHYNSTKTLFPESIVSFETGGMTKDIPKITHEDLKNFHDTYYHPSNMVMTLYGDLDYKKYLEYADEEYLSQFEKVEIDKNDKLYKPIDGFVEKVYDFPVASTSDTKNGSMIIYAVSCEDISSYEAGIFSLVLDDLSSDAGYIRNRLNEKLPKANCSIMSYLNSAKPYVEFIFDNVEESDKNIIKEVVEGALKDELEYGFDEETLESFIDISEMDEQLEKDSHGFTDYLGDFYEKTFKDNGKDLLGYFRYLKGIKDIRLRYEDGTVYNLIKKYFGDNLKSTLTVTSPKKGLLDQNIKENRKVLDDMKMSMTNEQIEELVDNTKGYNKWVEDNNSFTLIDKVRVASVSSLDEYMPKCYAYEENIEGIRFIRSDIDDIEYSYVNILLDASKIEPSNILKYKLLSDLLLYLPTTNYKDFTLSNEFSKFAYSYGSSAYNNVYFTGGYNPYLTFQLMALDKNIDKTFELIDEVFFETKFEDVEKLKTFASQAYNSYKVNFTGDPSSTVERLIAAISNDDYLFDVYIDGIDYMNYLHEITTLDDGELLNILKDCEKLFYELKNRDGMVCEIISNSNMISNLKSKVLDLSSKFYDYKRKANDFNPNIRKYKNNLAVVADTLVQYNYIVYPLKKNGIDFSGKYYVFNKWLDNDVLYPEFRVKRSCYGAYSDASIYDVQLSTYRDPNLKETYDTYKSLSVVLENMNISEESLEDYKLNAYSDFSYPLTKFEAASIAISEIISKQEEKRPERYARYMREIKNTTLSDIQDLKEIYLKLIEEGYKIAVGSSAQIANNAEYFDEIIYDYVKE